MDELISGPLPRSGTSTASCLTASLPPIRSLAREKQGMSFHSRSPMANVIPNAMPNKLNQGDLLPALDPGMLTPAASCLSAPGAPLHPK